ncbi:hypothetical protein A9Q91_00720 [Candidatus Gracilibacteria bacterium 28_42_T64]|nr:hypothetical protein A9Q91_00720 [Candidatus Gracilibacteria bacterium 28_42_T64]
MANNPRFETNIEYEMLWELGSCKHKYIREVVSELEKIKKGEIEKYSFGYDITTIYCYAGKENAVIEYEKIDPVTYKGINKRIEIPFENIYSLMKDWRDYIDAWEKETDLEKK